MFQHLLSQEDAAATKTERGHSCPQQRPNAWRFSKVPTRAFHFQLLRTRMCALRKIIAVCNNSARYGRLGSLRYSARYQGGALSCLESARPEFQRLPTQAAAFE